MHRLGLVLVLAVTLVRPHQPPASLDGYPTFTSGPGVCSIDPTWGIELPDRPRDSGGDVRFPKDIDPAFEWPVPCFQRDEPVQASTDSSLGSLEA